MSLKSLLGGNVDYRVQLGLEEFGKLTVERELTLYAKLSNLRELEPLASIQQIQWKLDLGNDDVKFRARLENGKVHTICCKRPNPNGDGMLEVETTVTAGFWQQMIVLFGNHGYKKTRYLYPIPDTNLKFEIDVFLTESGQPHPWVKIDLEYPQDLQNFPTLPFSIDQDCLIIGNEMNSLEADFVDKLWEDEWSRLDSTKGSLDLFYNPQNIKA